MSSNVKIAVASGKGGTGKTTFAVNLFHTLAATQPSVLIDCDVEEPNSKLFLQHQKIESESVKIKIPKIDSSRCIYCGKCVDVCAFNAIMYVKSISYLKLMEDLCHGCGGCAIVCNKGAIKEIDKELGIINTYKTNSQGFIIEGELNIGVATPVPIINKAISQAENHKIAILDAPPGTSCPAVATVSEADYVILVAEPTPFGLNDLKLSIEAFSKMDKKMGVVINKAGIGNDETINYLANNSIEILGTIPFEKKYAATISEGKLLIGEHPEIQHVFKNILNKISATCSKLQS